MYITQLSNSARVIIMKKLVPIINRTSIYAKISTNAKIIIFASLFKLYKLVTELKYLLHKSCDLWAPCLSNFSLLYNYKSIFFLVKVILCYITYPWSEHFCSPPHLKTNLKGGLWFYFISFIEKCSNFNVGSGQLLIIHFL